LAVTAFLVFLADYLTKHAAVKYLIEGPFEIFGNVFKLQLVFNTGAAFSIATNATIFLSVFSMSAAAGILYFASRVDSIKWALGLGLVLGGIFGNLTDRIFREPYGLQGAVVDWISVLSWPTFNVADSAVVVGVLLIVNLIWRKVPPRLVTK
jgi:signal peptidase II